MPYDVDRPFELDAGDGCRGRFADPAMIEVFATIASTAASRVPYLITGETGVGKELAARAVHRHSGRRGRLIAINCGGLPDALVEAELFGHEPGAFTGAHLARPGCFEQADGGTLFLDELAELSLRAQSTLLRVLDGQPIQRLGGRSHRAHDVRIIAATNCDLERAVGRGGFRRDLFHRLLGRRVHLPPLRERPADIRLLAGDLLDHERRALGRPLVAVAGCAMQELLRRPWPGNVRELKHTMACAAQVCSDDVMTVDHLPTPMRSASASTAGPSPAEAPPRSYITAGRRRLSDEVNAVERRYIVEALIETGGNQTRAALLLGMPRRTLVRKLKQHALSDLSRDGLAH